jgi:PAS domain S-box-containing protein
MLAELESLRRRVAELEAARTERGRLATDLRDLEERSRAVLDSLPLLCIAVNPEGYVIDLNAAAMDLLGVEVPVAGTTHLRDILRCESEGGLEELTDGLINGAAGGEVKLRRPDASESATKADCVSAFKTEVCSSTIHTDALGRHVSTVIVLSRRDGPTDQTSEPDHDHRCRLEESENRYRSLFEESIDVVYITSRDGRLIDISPSAAALFGIPRGQLLGRDVHGLYADPEQRVRFQKAIEKDGFVRGFEITLLHSAGSRVDCLLTSTIRRDAKGETLGYQGIIRDITARKRAEAARERERRTFRVIAEAAARATDIPSLCQRMLDGLVEVLGYDSGTLRLHDRSEGVLKPVAVAGIREENLALLFDQSISDDRECIAAHVARTGEPILASDVTAHKISASHAKRLAALGIRALTACPVFGAERNLLAVILLFSHREMEVHEEEDRLFFETVAGMLGAVLERKLSEDEKREVQAQLIQAQKMEAVGTLASGVAHDFNNLLTAIQGFAELALLGVDESDRIHEDLVKIRTAADRGAGLVRQLLMFGREEPVQLKPVNINEAVSGMVKMLSPLIGEDIMVKTTLQSGLWPATADEGSIQQVLMNLAVNARDAMPDGGTLTLRTRNVTFGQDCEEEGSDVRPGDFVCISVEDSGSGMDEETIARIFEPFFSTKERGKGTGLGLAVVYGIVKQHGGWIYTLSTPRMGTTFEIYLPASVDSHARSAGSATPELHKEGAGERILVVEDEDSVRDLATRVLRKCGYSVFEAANVEQALSIFHREDGRFDLIFSDVVLPDRSGVQLADELLGIDPGLRILMSSGHASNRSQWDTIKTRGIPFIQKPYSLPALLQKVRETMQTEPYASPSGDGTQTPQQNS